MTTNTIFSVPDAFATHARDGVRCLFFLMPLIHFESQNNAIILLENEDTIVEASMYVN